MFNKKTPIALQILYQILGTEMYDHLCARPGPQNLDTLKRMVQNRGFYVDQLVFNSWVYQIWPEIVNVPDAELSFAREAGWLE